MSRVKYTDEDIKEFVESNSNCKFNGNYVKKTPGNNRRILQLTCMCGKDFEVEWVRFNRTDGKPQRQCKKCGLAARGQAQRMTDKEYSKRKYERGIKIQHLEPPVGRHVGIKHVCPSCGNENWKPTPSNILNGLSTKCTKCHLDSIAGHNKIDDATYQWEKLQRNIKIVNIEAYINMQTNIKHLCPDCGGEWSVAPGRILSRNSERCEPCSYFYRGNNQVLSTEEVNAKIEELNCEWVSGKYTGKASILTFKCECGKNFKKQYSDFRNGWNRCSKCMNSLSTGENAIKKWLEKNEINFIHQQKFDDLRGKRKRPLPFDFGIYDEHGNLQHLIEYDGAYHFKPMYGLYKTAEEAERMFEETKLRDSLKSQYAENNSIPLTRLSGTQYKYLDRHLKHLL